MTFEGEREAQDRISKLPDAILCHALSFLPTKLAAQTGILSKRWKDVWVQVPVLDFEMHMRGDFEGDMSTFDSFAKPRIESFMNFVDRLLAARGNSSIRKFRLSCDQIDPQRLYTWMCAMRDVEELDLYIWELGGLPWSNFVGKSLKVMKLSWDVLPKIQSPVSFPNLKILHLLSVKYADDKSIETLLSSCSILEDLQIERTEWDNVSNFVISVPSLKRLTLDFTNHEIYLEDDVEFKLFVDAPNIEYLRLYDVMSDSIMVNPMPYVTESYVAVNKISEIGRTEEQIRNYGNDVCRLFRSIRDVNSLTIGPFTMESLSGASDRKLTIFHNLVHLELELNGVNGAMLLPTLLEISPKLQSLVLPQGITYPGLQGYSYEEYELVNYSWKPPQNVPECLLFSLKRVEIRRITGEVEEEVELLKYFLENAMVMETMTITCEEYLVSGGAMDNMKERGSDACEPSDRFAFRDELMNHTKGSAACQLDIQLPQVLCQAKVFTNLAKKRRRSRLNRKRKAIWNLD